MHTDAHGAPASVDIFGVRVATLPLDEIADEIVARAAPSLDGVPDYVCATSVHGLVESTRDEEFFRILERAWIVAPDGMPLVWMGRRLGARHMQRVYGPDLTKAVCAASAGTGIRHFFYGGAPGVPEELAHRLSVEFPGLEIAGTYSPPFRRLTPEELSAVADRINQSRADIVWVGLSTPKQERWIAQVRELLTVRVLISVGAAFDFHTGRVKQAPRWMQARGLEWLFRLTREPRRLWRRYAYNNTRFVYLALRQLLRGSRS